MNRTSLLKGVLALLGSFLILLSVNPGFVPREELPIVVKEDPPFLSVDSAWVDSLMAKMSVDEKIAQLLMVQAYSNMGQDHEGEIEKLIQRHKIGGIIFFHGTAERQVKLINRWQNLSETPLLVGMDAEWGLDFRLKNTIKYPRQMALGAITDDNLIRQLGQDMAEQLRAIGVHMNFSPVADINNNPGNPVINTRSFGEDRRRVSEKVNALYQGMQDGGLLVTAKHFPGHGDTNVDSHHALPVIGFSRERLDSIELFPYYAAIPDGLSGIMVAHLHVPSLDSSENRPTSLSKRVVTGLLKEEMGFEGLVVTDAMTMQGVNENFKPVEAEIEALKAGNDILLMPSDVSKVITGIHRAIRRDEISMEQVEASCRKVLMAKAYMGLDTLRTVPSENLQQRITHRKYIPLQEKLVEGAITLVRDSLVSIPFSHLERLDYATMNIGVGSPTEFTERLDLYKHGAHYYYEDVTGLPSGEAYDTLMGKYNTLVISLYYTRSFGNNYDIPEGLSEYLDTLDFDGNVILNLFGYPYALDVLGSLETADAIMVSYTRDSLNQVMAAEGLFGGISITGTLPVSVGERFPVGTGIQTAGGTRLRYRSPEAVAMSHDTLKKIDSIVNAALREKAIPGCQVLVARKGNVIWNKAYGHHTFRRRNRVQYEDVYDLASITKIASTVPALMRLQDQGRFSVDSILGAYYPGIDTSAKDTLPIRDILTHQAGLTPWIPFYMNTIEPMDTSQTIFSTNFNYTYSIRLGPAAFANRNIVYKDSIYDKKFSMDYPVRVANDLYMRSAFRDSIYKWILQSPLKEKKYHYSDLGYYFLYRSVEMITDTLFYPYNWMNFYGPLGAESLGFLPLNRYPKSRILPTENDRVFRRQLIHGDVHDPGAAMLGGIAGHAGLYSNANDLAKMMQMFLQYGSYGGKRFIDSATIAEFTREQFPENDNRRGLGFDRPITDEADAGPACDEASELSYGHSGFTGTLAWVDPEYDLVYIFLSNRIHPNQDNFKLISSNVRTNIMEKIYHAIEDADVRPTHEGYVSPLPPLFDP